MSPIALSLWLLVVIFAARGALRALRDALGPRILRVLVFPGTVVASVGYVVGATLTGGNVRAVSPWSAPPADDGGSAAVGPGSWFSAITAYLGQLTACVAGLILLAKGLGVAAARGMFMGKLPRVESWTLAGAWDLLHATLGLMERVLDGIRSCSPGDWRAWVFLYLLTCLTLRTAPLRGSAPVVLWAGLVIGAVVAAGGWLAPTVGDWLGRGVPVLGMLVAVALLLWVASAGLRAASALIRGVRRQPETS
jgi:hypothetical protein